MNTEATAAQTGSDTPSQPAADAGASRKAAEPRSIRESVSRALEAAEVLDSPAPNQTDQARAVLKDGAGADEKMVGDDQEKRRKAAETVDREARKQAEAAEKKAGEKGKDDDADKDGKADAKKDAKKSDARAGDKDAKDAKDAKGEKDEGKAQRERDEHGKFKSAEGKETDAAGEEDTDEKVSEPPQRLSEAAKKAWAKAPKEIRGDVHRMVREYENGLAKNREAAGQWEGLMTSLSPVKTKDGKQLPYSELVKSMNTTPRQALDNYIAVDIKLSEDPIGTIDTLLRNRGMDFRKVAEAFLKLDPAEVKHHQEVAAKQAEIDRLEREKAEGQHAATREKRAEVDAHIATFYEKHPRLAGDKEFEKDFGHFFMSGRAKSLEEAYELAEKLHPRQAPRTDAPDQAAQTRKSELSDSGSRTTASDATSRRERSKNPRDSAERALRDVGL